jgi:hypothetical protein
MERKSARLWGEFINFYTSAWIDLPFAAVKQMFGAKGESISEVGWRAYDSWVGLMNEATNELYANRIFADASGRALEAAFTMRHVSDQFALALTASPKPSAETAGVESSPATRDGGRSVVTDRGRDSMAKAA